MGVSLRIIRTGAIAWGILAIFSVACPVLHAIPDLLFQLHDSQVELAQAVLTVSSFSFLTAGLVMEPVMVVCILLFARAFVRIRTLTGSHIALITAFLLFLYAAGRIFWAWADVNVALSIGSHDHSLLWTPETMELAGVFKGVAAAGNGTIATAVAVSLMIHFKKTELASRFRPGMAGSGIILATIIPAVMVKIATLWVMPAFFTALFLLLMTIKSVGIMLTAIAVYRQSEELG